jgi:hypothetical protein
MLRRFLCIAGALGCASALAACSSSSATTTPNGTLDSGGADVEDVGPEVSDDSGLQVVSYKLTPSNAILEIDTATAGSTATQDYTLIRTEDGVDTDVTASTTFTVDDSALGAFVGAKFTSATVLPTGVLGRTTQVRATPGNAIANVTVIALRTTGALRDFFFTIPYGHLPIPAKDTLKFGTKLKQVDVAFLMDTTASMGPEIQNLRDTFSTPTTGIVAQLKAKITNVGFAVARHEDFPVSPFGYDGSTGGSMNKPYVLLSSINPIASIAQSNFDLLIPFYGGNFSESQYEAQYQLLTGEGFAWTADVAGSIAPKATGSSGGANWRAGSLPIVVGITDAGWNESGDYASASAGKLVPHTRDQVVDAYKNKVKGRFVGIQAIIEKSGGGMDTPCTDGKSSSCDSARGYQQALDMATATGSVVDPGAFAGACGGQCCTGPNGAGIAPDGTGKCPLVFQAKTDGTGVGSSVVSAIIALSVGATFDVTAIPSNDPTNVDATGTPVDATKFIAKIRAMAEGDATAGCNSHAVNPASDTFLGVTVGTPVCFEITAAQNDLVQPSDQPQFFRAYVAVVGVPGAVKLEDPRQVLFLVPPKDPITQ